MIKWLGGATAAIVLAFGAVAVAGQWTASADGAGAAPTGQTITVDNGARDSFAIEVDPASFVRSEPVPIARAATVPPAVQPIVQPVTQSAVIQSAVIQPAVATEADNAGFRARFRQTRDERFTVKRILPIDGPIRYGEWHWDAEGVPAGPIVMTVDLDARVISVFRGGHEIGASAVLLGTDKHPTPLGTFSILFKMRHNVSEKYNNAPMPYSMFLTRTGIALHGSAVENGYASHGCIGMPDDFAAKVFAVAKKGDKVIITKGETLGMGDRIL